MCMNATKSETHFSKSMSNKTKQNSCSKFDIKDGWFPFKHLGDSMALDHL